VSAAEREEFLAGGHAGVLSTAAGTAGRTLAVSTWYSYQPSGLLTVLTGPPVRSRKAAAKPAAGIGSGMLIARRDSSPRQNIPICAALPSSAQQLSRIQIGGSRAGAPITVGDIDSAARSSAWPVGDQADVSPARGYRAAPPT